LSNTHKCKDACFLWKQLQHQTVKKLQQHYLPLFKDDIYGQNDE
jgi:hypothetical protein